MLLSLEMGIHGIDLGLRLPKIGEEMYQRHDAASWAVSGGCNHTWQGLTDARRGAGGGREAAEPRTWRAGPVGPLPAHNEARITVMPRKEDSELTTAHVAAHPREQE